MRKEIKILGALAIVVVGVAVFVSMSYRSSVQNERRPTSTANTAAPTGQLVREDSATLGPTDAKVTVVEFYDPECEACAEYHPVLKKILKDYDGKIRLVARYMTFHPNSIPAASFIEAAAEQGKYWQAQELLFEKQPEWGMKHGAPSSEPEPDINALFNKYAKQLGLDLNKASQAIKEERYAEKIARDKKDGQGLGVRKTPTIFVNGKIAPAMDEQGLRRMIDEELRN
jgi:protein-disulfide isomerase